MHTFRAKKGNAERLWLLALQMFTGVYRVIKGFFCKICWENPIITIRFPCKYYRGFPADIAKKTLVTL
jgi:hypothetical protein